MPEYRAPGVYVEETSSRARSIEGVGTHTTAFVGPTLKGPDPVDDGGAPALPALLTSFGDFEHLYGGLGDLDLGEGLPLTNHLAYAARAFFNEGGSRLYISRTPSHDLSLASCERALATIEPLEDVSLVAAPGSSAHGVGEGRENHARVIARALIAHAERPGACRLAVLDTPPGCTLAQARAFRAALDSTCAALYHPWVVAASESGEDILLPPSGFICGIFARSDVARGVHKSPANEVVRGARRFEFPINKAQQDVLNPEGINCLRFFEGRGFRVWGARTLSRDPEWKYLHIRRWFNHLEASVQRGTQWVGFEPNGERLWAQVREVVTDFLYREWRKGALQGQTPEEAFFVKCDRTTMAQNDLDNGRLICLIGVAFLRPAEFVVLCIQQKTAA